jgi:spermidine/putrescine transport system ATP-binding protein
VKLVAGPQFTDAGQDGDVFIVIRPENLRIAERAEKTDLSIEGEIRDLVYLGSHLRYRVAVPGHDDMIVHVDPDEGLNRNIGETIRIGWQQKHHRIVSA